MFSQAHYYKIQPEAIMNHQNRQFTVTDPTDQKVATFEEDSSTSNDWMNHGLKFFNLQTICSLHIKLLSIKQESIARLVKKKGWFNDVVIDTDEGEIHLNFKLSTSQKVTATDAKGTLLFQAVGKNMASDFSVTNEGETVATIQKRSIAAPTTKEAWLSNDLYHVRAAQWNEKQAIAVLAMTIMIDLYLHTS